MKFVSIKFLAFFLVIIKQIIAAKSSNKFLSSSQTDLSSDSILERVRLLIKEISNKRLKSEDLNIKKKLAGVLPEGYPEEMVKNAKKMRYDKKLWSPLMSFPTEVWRFCLFPLFKVNYQKFCRNQYMTGTEDEINGIYIYL